MDLASSADRQHRNFASSDRTKGLCRSRTRHTAKAFNGTTFDHKKNMDNKNILPTGPAEAQLTEDNAAARKRLADAGGTDLSPADFDESERARAELMAMPLESVTAMVRGAQPAAFPGTTRRRIGTSVRYDTTFGALAISYACAIKVGQSGEEEFGRLVSHVDARAATLPQVTQRSKITRAAAALLQVNIEDDDEREKLLVQVREISAALDMVGAEASGRTSSPSNRESGIASPALPAHLREFVSAVATNYRHSGFPDTLLCSGCEVDLDEHEPHKDDCIVLRAQALLHENPESFSAAGVSAG
jgi:hypothetical protein